jgi:hypothetical protein
MALSTTQYGYIIDPMVPFTDGKGETIKDGFVRVFVAGSSTPVVTYRNFDGAANQDMIELDNSGRTKTSVIGSKGYTYKVCVYDKMHSQESPILTVDNVSVIGANITVGSGATVVTGIDGLTTKPDGFVDASVVGTDGYVALDHTLVNDELDTDAKATAVENDRYIPLLNKDVNAPDSKMTLGRLCQWIFGNIKNQSPVIKFVEPSLTQVTAAIADGYIPMIKRPAGQGYRYYLLMWVGSEAWFASVGHEEISRLVITGSGFTETTDKLRDVVTISLIGGGSYVSNTDYERAIDGSTNNQIVVLQGGFGSVNTKGYLIAVGSVGLRFMRVVNDNVQLVNVSPTETPDGHAVTYENLVSDGGFNDIVDFDFADYTESVDGNIAYPIANNKMQIQSDWDSGLSVQAAFIAPSDTSNNAIVKLENVQTNITWNVQIWNHSKTALLPLVKGSATAFKKGASYVLHLYGDKVYVSQVVNQESAPVTEDDLQEAINTLRSRSVFVMDVGEIAGQVSLNPNGTSGFIGTLFSPYMDFDLSVDTKVVFDVEQMGGQGEMTRFVIALYEYNSATGEFNWVANTVDLSTQIDSTDRRLGLHSGKLQYIRQNAKLFGGKMYYAVACGHWNGWAFAGNTFATTLHSSVTPAFQCDNRSVVIDPATLGSGSYAKLYATDQSDQTKVDYHNISGSRMFMAFTNAAVSI